MLIPRTTTTGMWIESDKPGFFDFLVWPFPPAATESRGQLAETTQFKDTH